MFRPQLIVVSAWFALMLAVVGTSVALGVPVTAAGLAGWLVLGCLPPLVLVTVFGGSGPATLSPVMTGATPVPAATATTAPVTRNVITP